MHAEHAITRGSLYAELHMTSCAGTFEHAASDSLRLLVRCNQSGPHMLAGAARELRDAQVDQLHPFQLTGTAPHAVQLALETGHSTRYERQQLINASIKRCEQIVEALAQRVAMEAPQLDEAPLALGW